MHDDLLQALARVDRPGDICVAGDLPLTMPGLEVEGLGVLRLPFGKAQARELIDCCQQAPYGKGTQTLVDTSVRRVWELDAGRVRFTNPKWEQVVDSIIDEMRQKLGLEGKKLTASLYKLLVYEQGSFFLPHRDGEKHDGMVATLVVALPSAHEGGELIISHNGHRHEISFPGAASEYELSYAAFYADCEHEVLPIKSGYRLGLTYNVMLAKSRGRKDIAAPSYGEVVDDLEALLNSGPDKLDTQKLALTLEHRYTRSGLTVESLKGVDRSRAEVLFEAARRANWVAHLALVTLWQRGTAEYDYEDDSYGRNRGYRWRNDFEDDMDGSDYEMGDIFESHLSADHWSDSQGRTVGFGEIRLRESEIVADSTLDEDDPEEEEFEGYTGNAGMTLDRWYHRAAVVIWPRETHYAVLCEAGTDASISGLEVMVKRLERSSESAREALRQECVGFAAAIIDGWPPAWRGSKIANRNRFSGLVCTLDDRDLIGRFLKEVLASDRSVQLDPTFAKFCKRHGYSSLASELLFVMAATTQEELVRNAELANLLCRQGDSNPERFALCARLCERLVEKLESLDSDPQQDSRFAKNINRAALLVALVNAMLAIDEQPTLGSLIDHALLHKDRYELTETHLAAIFSLEPRLNKLTQPNEPIKRWLDACRQELEARTASPPEKPTDYQRAHELSCNCKDCHELSRFLAHPERQKARFSMRQGRRTHLEHTIQKDNCDLKHVTEQRGRPYTLVCTKTTASFHRACEIYRRDTENLARITGLERQLA